MHQLLFLLQAARSVGQHSTIANNTTIEKASCPITALSVLHRRTTNVAGSKRPWRLCDFLDRCKGKRGSVV